MEPERRYQVFVSSTYEDLQEERREVMQALLELDCMPSGMELFPAADDDAWTLIKRVIDDCDYYLVIIAGRYGSTGQDGRSYTQMEYEYAVERDKPIIAFLHKEPESLPARRTESSETARERLKEFRVLAQKKVCKAWQTPAELGSVVSRSLIKLIKQHPAVGWVRGDQVPDTGTTEEILALRKQIDDLQRKLETSAGEAPAGTEGLAQGDDPVEIRFDLVWSDPTRPYETQRNGGGFSVNWNELFGRIAPLMIDSASDTALRQALSELAWEKNIVALRELDHLKDKRIHSINLMDDSFRSVMVQFRALNLVAKRDKSRRGVYDRDTYWALTPYGDKVMTRLRAIRRPSGEPAA